jgi:hypothetical protein
MFVVCKGDKNDGWISGLKPRSFSDFCGCKTNDFSKNYPEKKNFSYLNICEKDGPVLLILGPKIKEI